MKINIVILLINSADQLSDMALIPSEDEVLKMLSLKHIRNSTSESLHTTH